MTVSPEQDIASRQFVSKHDKSLTVHLDGELIAICVRTFRQDGCLEAQ